MFLLTLKKSSEDNIFQDPYSDGICLIWKTFFSEEKAREEMMKDFTQRFDSDSSASLSENKIEIQMLNDKYVYEVSRV